MNLVDFFHAVVYGIVQGITEFLPISSTAHLTLIPRFFGWSYGGMGFDVALHVGTAAAVIVFFWRRWVQLIKAGFTQPKSPFGKLFWIIVVSTIPASLVGVLLNDKVASLQSDPYIIGVCLIFMGAILWAVDRSSASRVTDLTGINVKTGILIGLAQCLAIIPGVSRSGITITAGRALGVNRETAAEFTFLLSLPIIAGDAGYHFLKMRTDATAAADLAAVGGTGAMIVGIVVSFLVGLGVIKFLLDFLKKRSLAVFAIYRFVLGALVLVWTFGGFFYPAA
ncbi:MAG: undecaprenyl-diphosphatase UppP [Propionibacteriaceae bacterium]|nr:undecaprenyl-diphosphatase UppP [Propionibacteriaceae bacterium]